MTRSLRWLFLGPLTLACGYVGFEDLEPPISNLQTPEDPKGAKPGDGDGDGDGDGSTSPGGDGGTGGADSGAGGTESAAGGSEAGAGGTEAGAGGSIMGTGGAWEPVDETWNDPNRAGCWPFCAAPFNLTFVTQYLFEQPVVPAPGVESSGDLYVSVDYAHWGIGSLGVHFDESPSYAYIPTSINAGRNMWIYVRAHLRIPSDAIQGDVGLLDFISTDVPMAHVATHPGARLSAAAPLNERRVLSAPGAYPKDEWFCLRVAVLSSEMNGAVTVEANGVVVAELVGVRTRNLMNINNVSFGVTSTGPFVTGGDLYWDSLVIDHEPVTCDDMTLSP